MLVQIVAAAWKCERFIPLDMLLELKEYTT